MAGERGLFVTIEGGEGAGKSTVAAALGEELRARAVAVLTTEEPSWTGVGRAVRSLLSAGGHETPAIAPMAELLLFEADRAQHLQEILVPALERGEVVICDRFADSTIAYQGYGRGLDLDFVRRLNEAATAGRKPDLTLLLDLPPHIGLAREGEQTDATGRESLEFHERVREGFLALAAEEPRRIVVIDATQPPDVVLEAASHKVEAKLAEVRRGAVTAR